MKFFAQPTLLAILLTAFPAAAQEPVPNGLLMMVKEGVFELAHGKSIDVTDRKILVSFPKTNSYFDKQTGEFKGGNFFVSINGDTEPAQAGRRFDLKKMRSTSKFVADTDVCMLDVVELIEAKGTAARAVMRINCE